MSTPQGPRVYNLFPRLAGKFTAWRPHLERAAAMNFNWVFLNPVHFAGFSGSMYAVKDHYAYDPALVDTEDGIPAEEQLRRVLAQGRELGLRFMLDLVVNHTAIDAPLVAEHPAWYHHEGDGQVRHPGAWDGGNWVSWGDLAAVDNATSPERAALWDYWEHLVAHYQELGFTGFRCDAAYQVSGKLWSHLIRRAKGRGEALFFAETLGCTVEQTIATAKAGFDYIFNSFKWWDFAAPWFLEQYRQTAKVAPSVAFPESHDTERVFPQGGELALKQRYALAASVSAGVLMPIGYEFGFSRKLDVVHTTTADWEQPAADVTGFIARVNAARAAHPIFNVDTAPRVIGQDNPEVVCLSRHFEGERLLICANRDLNGEQQVWLDLGRLLGKEAAFTDLLLPERRLSAKWGERLMPGEVVLVHTALPV